MRGTRSTGDRVLVVVEGAGPTLTEALNDAMDRALKTFPEATKVEVYDYDFEGDTVEVTHMDGSVSGTLNGHIGLSAKARVYLRSALTEEKRQA